MDISLTNRDDIVRRPPRPPTVVLVQPEVRLDRALIRVSSNILQRVHWAEKIFDNRQSALRLRHQRP
jgi:hypothetical protein